MSFTVAIPARYASTRFPGKPLALLAGKPMLQHVYENAKGSNAGRVVVATDDDRIRERAERFGAEVIMTASTHSSGTERLAEVVTLLGLDKHSIVVNVQGDEPLLPPQLINQVADLLAEHGDAQMSTLCERIDTLEALLDPNIVKVVVNNNHTANYFSRAPVPWPRACFDRENKEFPARWQYFRHLGIYAYRASYLAEFVELPMCEWEQAESLEQLRTLYYGGVIAIATATMPTGPGIDTPEDLQQAQALVTADP